tara:strand:- start:2397 stop:4067 length:1671 start_codon:yes stop_codon:yes gene_type:complete
MTFDLSKGEVFNALAWILNNKFVNENGMPIEFSNHSFLIDPFLDISPHQVVKKSAQIGWSTLAILRSFHLAKFMGLNIIYTLPTFDAVSEFVKPKVNPIIEANPELRRLVSTGEDSVSLKRVGDRFIYFKSSWTEREAISISADLLINDELDRSKLSVIKTYASRLGASKFGWKWRFSNPSIPEYGVDEDWIRSDQKHWFIKCPCGHETYLNWFMEDDENRFKNHFVDMDTEKYVCGKCHREIDDQQRRKGRWVQKYKDRKISGYWISQLMAAWIPASKIMSEYLDSRSDLSYFYNFVLGLPYASKDMAVSRQAIIDCIVPGSNRRGGVAMGVDNGVIKHYVIGNSKGIFAFGETKDWDEIETLFNRYKAHMVIDANPYPNHPKKLAEKYKGRVFVHYYQRDQKSLGVVRWGEKKRRGEVVSDRTKIIDLVVSELNDKMIDFNITQQKLEDYIVHWRAMYRVVEKDSLGVMRGSWITPDGKDDHYAHATIYWRIAMEKARASTGIGGVRSPERKSKVGKKAYTVSDKGGIPVSDIIDINKAARLSGIKKRRSFKDA